MKPQHIKYAIKNFDQPLNGPPGEKTCLLGFANNKGADQPAHLCSLISIFVIPFSERTILNLATGKISIFEPVSVSGETC